MGSIVLVLLAAAMLTPWALARWAGRLPYAPECPHCRSVTGQRPARGHAARAYERVTATVVRSCARCGWAGRMRWRLAPQRVAGHR